MCNHSNEIGESDYSGIDNPGNGWFSYSSDVLSSLKKSDNIESDDHIVIGDKEYIGKIKEAFFGNDVQNFVKVVGEIIGDESDDHIVIGDKIEDFIGVFGSGSVDDMCEAVEKLLKAFKEDRNYDFIEAFCIAFLGYKCDGRDNVENNTCIGGNTNDTIDLKDFLKKLESKRMERKSGNIKE